MAIQLDDPKGGRVRPHMNVTPLVDVVLVLLIIFMVLAPVVTGNLGVRVPPKDTKKDAATDVSRDLPVVLTVHRDGSVELNGRGLERDEIPRRLPRMFETRSNRMVYVDGRDDAIYGDVVRVVAAARRGGAGPIVLLTRKLQ